MGETPTEIEREIAEIRGDMELVVDELERRVRHLLDLRHQAEDHPTAAMAVGAGLIVALAFGALGLFGVFRARPAEPAGLIGAVARTARRVRERLPIQVYVVSKPLAEQRILIPRSR